MAHPPFTAHRINFRRHIKTSELASGSCISSSLPVSPDALIFIFSSRNQYEHFLAGKPGRRSENHAQSPLQPRRKRSLGNPEKLRPYPSHRVRWKPPSSNVASFHFPMDDTDALPHVVHLIRVKLESAQ